MKSKKITVSTAIALLMMVATLFFVGCSTGTGGGSSSTNNPETNQPGGIVTFKTSVGIESYIFLKLAFIFNTTDKTVVVEHSLKEDKHGSYEGNVNVDGKIRMYNNKEEMEGTISGSGKYLTADLPDIGETTLTRVE